MAVNKLSDSFLKRLIGKPQESPLVIADGLGLSARVSAQGAISWLFRFKDPISSKQAWLTLGKYPDLSIKNARIERNKCREWIAEGLDPRTERRLNSGDPNNPTTVKNVLDFWLEKYAKKYRKNHSDIERQFQRWIYAEIGDYPIAKVEKRHWIACFDKRVNKSPVAAGVVLRTVQQALKFCKKRDIEISNSVFDLDIHVIGAKKHTNRSRRLIDETNSNELIDLINLIDNESVMPYYRNLIRLLIIFGCRTQEIRLSKVNEWDLDAMIWTVPPAHNKTSAKDQERGLSGEIKRPIPNKLKPFILNLIEQTPNEYLMGEVKSSSTVATYAGKLYKQLGHTEKWRLHDLRRTVATGMNDIGIAPHIVESILGHAIHGVAGIYNRSQYLLEKKEALEKWYLHVYNITKKSDSKT